MCAYQSVYTLYYTAGVQQRETDREIIQRGEIITVFDRRLWADSLCVLNDQLESLIRKIKCLNLFFFFLIQERYIILIVAPTNLYTLCNGSHPNEPTAASCYFRDLDTAYTLCSILHTDILIVDICHSL